MKNEKVARGRIVDPTVLFIPTITDKYQNPPKPPQPALMSTKYICLFSVRFRFSYFGCYQNSRETPYNFCCPYRVNLPVNLFVRREK